MKAGVKKDSRSWGLASSTTPVISGRRAPSKTPFGASKQGEMSDKKRSHESSSSTAGETHEERSLRKKTEKLRQCIVEIDSELSDLELRRKQAKKDAREATDGSKMEFLRTAATLQRKIDENSEEMKRLRAAVERDQPEVEELRQKLAEQLAQHKSRHTELENEHRSQVEPLRQEIEFLRSIPTQD